MFGEYETDTDPARWAPAPTDPTDSSATSAGESENSSTAADTAASNNPDPTVSGVSNQRSSAAADRPAIMQPAVWPLAPASASRTGSAAGDALINGTLTDDIGRLGAVVGESLSSGRPLVMGSGRDATIIIGAAVVEAALIGQIVKATGVKGVIKQALVTVGALLVSTALTGYVIASMDARKAQKTAALSR